MFLGKSIPFFIPIFEITFVTATHDKKYEVIDVKI